VAAKTPALGSNPLKKSESVVRDMLRGASSAPREVSTSGRTAQVHATPGLLRKTIYFDEDEWQAIRSRCYEGDRTYTEVVRAAVRAYLGLGERFNVKTSQR